MLILLYFYLMLIIIFEATKLQKQMRSIKTLENDNQDDLSMSESFSEQQSEYILPSTQSKNVLISTHARNQRRRRNHQIFNLSRWTLQQNILYKQFLNQNQHLFEADRKSARKLLKINVLMSQYVKTRSPDQCRSHHQKMKKNHLDVLSIIQYIEHQQHGVIQNKRQIGQEQISQHEIISIDQPQNSREIAINIQSIQENQKIREFVQDHAWHDYLSL